MQKTKLKKTLTKKSEILQEALKYLAVNEDYIVGQQFAFICNCINKVLGEEWNRNHQDKSGLISMINARMDGSCTLDAWLCDVHGINYAEMDSDNRVKLQETRRRWVLSMIEEFKAQGD